MTSKYVPSPTFIKQFVAGALLTCASSWALAQPQMTLLNNQLQITGGSGTTFSSQSPTISSLGVVQSIIDVPTTNGVGIPSFNFTINATGVPNGTYNYRVAVTFADASSPNRRMEAEIQTLTLTVNGGNITGTIPGGQNLRVLGRNGGGTLQVQMNVANSATNGPIRVTGGTVTFDASNLVTRIRNSNPSFDSIILAEFDKPATYTYRIAVQQTSNLGNVIQFGTSSSGTFTAFPQVQTVCAAVNCVANTTAFVLNGNELASDYTAAYTVTGQFNVVTVSSGGGDSGGATPTPTPAVNVSETTNNLTTALDNITIVPNATPSPQVVEQLNNAMTTTNTLLSNAATQVTSGGLTTTQALDTLSVAKDALSLAGQATAAGGNVNNDSSTNAIENLAAVVSALASRPLTNQQKDQVTTLAAETVTAAANLITADTPRSAILNLVEATVELLRGATNVAGEVRAALAQQLQDLSQKASTAVMATLPDNIKGSTDLTSVDSIRALTASSGTARQSVLDVSAPVPEPSPKSTPVFTVIAPPTATPTATPSASPSPSPSPSAAPSASPSPSVAPSASPSPTPTPTQTPPDQELVQFNVVQIMRGISDDDFRVDLSRQAFDGISVHSHLVDSLNDVIITSTSILDTASLGAGLNSLAATSISVESNPDNGTLRITSGSKVFSVLSTNVRIVPTTLAEGLSYLPDGRAVLVNNGLAFELAGAAVDLNSFVSGVAYGGFRPSFRPDGGVSIDLGKSERFAGAFVISDITSTTACGYPSFVTPTGNPASEAYAFTMKCANGITQAITPLTDSPAFYTTLANAGLEAQTNRDTGVVTIASVGRFKPSFFINPLKAADTTFLNANKNADGVAFRAKDANGDGRTDYEVLTANGVQVLYGLPN